MALGCVEGGVPESVKNALEKDRCALVVWDRWRIPGDAAGRGVVFEFDTFEDRRFAVKFRGRVKIGRGDMVNLLLGRFGFEVGDVVSPNLVGELVHDGGWRNKRAGVSCDSPLRENGLVW